MRHFNSHTAIGVVMAAGGFLLMMGPSVTGAVTGAGAASAPSPILGFVLLLGGLFMIAMGTTEAV